MYIERVVLSNVKGFSDLDFNLRRTDGQSFAGWTVLTGENGSGKTALLKAISLALVGPNVARALQPSWRGWIKEGCSKAEIAVQIVPGPQDKFTAGRPYEHAFWSEVELVRGDGPSVTLRPASSRRRGKKKGPINGPWAENTGGWFSVGYGPFRRLYGASSEAQRLMSAPGRIAPFATMFKEDATLGECEIWLTELSHRALESRKRDSELLEEVKRLLNDDFLRNDMRLERIDSEGLWLRDPSGAVLPLADVSEGYRAALALMVDLLRHLARVHDTSPLIRDDDGRLVVPHEGVVLVDEIDAHLHPAWQREIGFWLKQRFPKIQFIVTTHSPLVCPAADTNGIFHLPPPGSPDEPFPLSKDDYLKVIRAKADPILLGPAFGLTHTRSPRAVQARQDYAALQAKRRGAALDETEKERLPLLEMMIELDEREPSGE